MNQKLLANRYLHLKIWLFTLGPIIVLCVRWNILTASSQKDMTLYLTKIKTLPLMEKKQIIADYCSLKGLDQTDQFLEESLDMLEGINKYLF